MLFRAEEEQSWGGSPGVFGSWSKLLLLGPFPSLERSWVGRGNGEGGCLSQTESASKARSEAKFSSGYSCLPDHCALLPPPSPLFPPRLLRNLACLNLRRYSTLCEEPVIETHTGEEI